MEFFFWAKEAVTTLGGDTIYSVRPLFSPSYAPETSGSSASMTSASSAIPLKEVRSLQSMTSFGGSSSKKHLSSKKIVTKKAEKKDKKHQQLGRSKTAQFACFLKKGREQRVFAIVAP
eukprot:GEMP01051041.1.p1 GENE.GEMP01051041.1~~GEMP01051041.1.p1  ORF type:complete len:118 (+),score=20.93 GEMP01051041.1:416-769(+)